MVISLSSNSTAVVVSPYVFVPGPGGSNSGLSATFPITATLVDGPAAQSVNATITASYGPTPGATGQVAVAANSGLGLTAAALDAGFTLTTFATGFPTAQPAGRIGPLGIAFYGAEVLVVDSPGIVYFFSRDADGQTVADAGVTSRAYGTGNDGTYLAGLACLNGRLFMADNTFSTHSIVQIDGSGNLIGNPIALPATVPAICVLADPFTSSLFCSPGDSDEASGDQVIYGISWDPSGAPSAGPVIRFPLLPVIGPDGLALSADGTTLYIAEDAACNVVGYDMRSGQIVFDYNRTDPSGVSIANPDGIAIGTGQFANTLFVNTNAGKLFAIDVGSGAATLLADGGSRGDFVVPDPNGSLLITQTDRVLRLTPPTQLAGFPPLNFSDQSSGYLVSRDDQAGPYGPALINGAPWSATAGTAASFNMAGYASTPGPQVAWEWLQRGGQASMSGAAALDAQFGFRSVADADYSLQMPPLTVTGSSQPYTAGGQAPPLMVSDLQGSLGNTATYNLTLTDQVSAVCSGFTFTDTPEFGLPALTARNTLTATLMPPGNPQLAAGRTAEITLPWADPSPLGWEVLQPQYQNNALVLVSIASDQAPAGWNVLPDAIYPRVAWVTVPAGAAAAQGYEVRLHGGAGSGFFDVTSGAGAPVAAIQSVTVSSNPIIGGNSMTGTVTLDSPVPGATVSVCTYSAGVTLGGTGQQTLAVPVDGTGLAGQFEIDTTAVGFAEYATIFASYNGTQSANFYVVPTGGSPPGPFSLTATVPTGLTGTVVLNWTPAANSASYTILRSSSSSGPFTAMVEDLPATTLTYTDSSAANGVTYYYEAAAINPYGATYAISNAATPTVNSAGFTMTVSPSQVTGGYSALCTIALTSGPAPLGGYTFDVSVSASPPLLLQGSMSQITIPQNASYTVFAVETDPVASETQPTVTATEEATPPISATATVTIEPPVIENIVFDPGENPVVGPQRSNCTVTLNGPAPAAGLQVNLSASPSNGITILPPWQETTFEQTAVSSFNIQTPTVNTSLPVLLTATLTSPNSNPVVQIGPAVSATLVDDPATTDYYISGLSLSPTGIFAGGNVTITAQLNQPNSTGSPIVIGIKTSDTALQFPAPPAGTALPAGCQGVIVVSPDANNNGVGTVTATYNGSPDDVEYVTISGECNTWLQSAVLCVLPEGYDLSIQNLTATPGDHLVELTWNDLPSGSIAGYNVYRVMSDGSLSPNPLNTNGPITSPIFADTGADNPLAPGLVNGAQYRYAVTVKNLDQTESAPRYAPPAAPQPGPDLLLSGVPSGPITGAISLYDICNNGDSPRAQLVVDGASVSSSVPPGDLYAQTNGLDIIPFSTAALSNGSHVIQVIGVDGAAAVASQPVTVAVSNAFSSEVLDQVAETTTGELATFCALLPPGSAGWTAAITDEYGNSTVTGDGGNTLTLPSWTSSSAAVAAGLSWDGTAASGAEVPDGQYTLTVTAPGPVDPSVNIAVNKTHADPQGLAFVTPITADIRLAACAIGIGRVWRRLFKAVGLSVFRGYGGQALVYNFTRVSSAARKQYKRWISRSVIDLIIYSHGYSAGSFPGAPAVPFAATYGALNDFAIMPFTCPADRPDEPGDYRCFVPDLLAGRPLTFAFADFCCSAGGLDNQLGPSSNGPDPTWSNAFNISSPAGPYLSYGSFAGWNGLADAGMFNVVQFPAGKLNNWYFWRSYFELALEQGMWTWQAMEFADSATQANPVAGVYLINPWDAGREVWTGDLIGTFTQP
jgi:hypothetical protein